MAIWLLCLAALALLPRSVVGGRSGKDVGVITESGLVDVALNESNRSYSEGDPIGLEVEYIAGNRSIVKYDLYYSKFGFCRPDPIKYHGDGILHGMMGIERADTGLEVPFLKDLRCVEWCGDDIIPNEDISFINESINNDYYMRMYLGGVRVKAMLSPNSPLCAYDVPIGKKVGSSGLWTVPAYHNYYSFEVYCHKEDSGRYTIRDVVVRPESRRFRTAADCKDDNFNTDITSLNKEWGGRPAIFHSVKFVLDRDPACKVSSEHDSSDISYLKSYIGGLVLPTLVVVAANIITWSKKNNNAGEDHSYKELSKGDKDVVLTDLGLSYQDLSTIPQSVTLVSIMVAEGVHNLSMIMAAATMGLFGYFTTDNLPRIIVDSIAMYIILSFLRGFVSFGIYKFFLSATWVAPTPGLALLQPFLVLLYVFATREIIMRRGAPSYSNLDILLSLLVLYILLTVLTFAGSMNSGLLTSGSSPPETTDTNDDIHSKV